MNTTGAPETTPEGALVRVRVVVTGSVLPINAVLGALSDASDVAAGVTVTDVEDVSAMMGKAPVWSA